ncbi:hypothetical protein ACLOJK_013785 [Asimina triloba]
MEGKDDWLVAANFLPWSTIAARWVGMTIVSNRVKISIIEKSAFGERIQVGLRSSEMNESPAGTCLRSPPDIIIQ